MEGYILERGSPESSPHQRGFVKLCAEKGQSIQAEVAQVGVVEIHAVENTVLKNRFLEIGKGEVNIGQPDAGKFGPLQPRHPEAGADKNGFVETRAGQVQDGEVAIREVRAVKIGFAHIAVLERAASEICAGKVGAAQGAGGEFSFMGDHTRKVTPGQAAGAEVRGDLALEGAGEVGDLLNGLLDVTDGVNGQFKGFFIGLALSFEFKEALL